MATPDEVELKRWTPSAPVLCAWAVLLAVFGCTHWETIRFLVGTWWSQDDYHHCFFVPLFSLYLLWHRRAMVDPLPTKGSWWCLAMFAAAALIRLATVDLHYAIDHYSIFPFLVGLALCLGGWRALHWAWPAIGFLVFMIPLPGDAAVLLSHPLQRIATTAGVYTIQTLGIPAVAAGTTIELTLPPPLEVAEACSGIRMLTLFFAICVGAVFVIERPLWEKVIIVVSAIPIAIISNASRVTMAAILQDRIGITAKDIFHDYAAAWFVMFLAMAMLWAEMALIAKLVVEPPSEAPLILDQPSGRRRGGTPRIPV
jgi:exosortase